ncbi:MAG: bifunctional hydroxymethylpyrimidine kinase/phosphomethylpyrimidine kinase [Syntrophaceae bacterium]|nr:bifunctional hydroxymethylpyrimidine kinase/phosphomethylpyrimidine kinase [Syntrophaceae bacterium]
MKPVKILCIGGSDSSGGAGTQADLKAVSFCGCWGLTVITAVTAQNTKGVLGIYPVSPEFVGRQMDTILKDTASDAVKTGMLPTSEIVQTVANKIKKYKLKKVIVDPVMIAKGGRILMSNKARTSLVKDLLPLAFAATPNVPEAEVLSKMKIKSVFDMKKAAIKISRLGVKNVLIKGGHLTGNKKSDVTDILYNGNFYEFSSKRILSGDTHGTGCTYASALAAGIAKGENIVEAALRAKIMIVAAIKNAVTLGEGYSSANVFGEIFKKSTLRT